MLALSSAPEGLAVTTVFLSTVSISAWLDPLHTVASALHLSEVFSTFLISCLHETVLLDLGLLGLALCPSSLSRHLYLLAFLNFLTCWRISVPLSHRHYSEVFILLS